MTCNPANSGMLIMPLALAGLASTAIENHLISG